MSVYQDHLRRLAVGPGRRRWPARPAVCPAASLDRPVRVSVPAGMGEASKTSFHQLTILVCT